MLREVEIEVRRPPRRASGAREDDPQHVGVLVVAERASGSGAARRAPAARTTRRHSASASPAAPSPASKRASASRRSRSSTNGLCARVLTRISRQLNAAMSTPTESRPLSSAWTSVVPSPANGSSTRPPAGRDGGRAPRRAAGCTCRDTDGGGGRASSARARAGRAPTRRGRGRGPRRSAPAWLPREPGSTSERRSA